MPSRSLAITLVTAGVVGTLVAPRGTAFRSTRFDASPPDTLAEGWISQVTMDPIRVVVPLEMRMESVTMEPIRVVIPIAQSATETLEASDR